MNEWMDGCVIFGRVKRGLGWGLEDAELNDGMKCCCE